MAEECIFCRIIKGDIPSCKIYEDDAVLAFLDIGPLSEGHCLVIPKQHYNRLEECPPAVVSALGTKLGSIAAAVIAAVEATGYNVFNNNGRCAGQLVEHVHFHIVPRNPGDGVFNRWPSGKYAPGRMEELAGRIRGLL